MAAFLLRAKAGVESDIRRGIRISLSEAAVVGAMFAATEVWLIPLLQQRLGALPHVIGLLTIIPALGVMTLGAIARPVIAFLGGNRRTSVIMGIVQTALLWGLEIPVWYPGMPHVVDLTLVMIICIGLAGAISGPAWQSWMGDLVPRSMLGRYQSWRSTIFLPVKLAWGFIFAQVISHYPAHTQAVGLAVVFALAGLSRALSTLLQARQPVPAPRPAWRGPVSTALPATDITLWGFIRNLPSTDIGRWTLVWAVFMFGVCVSAPYVASYMLTTHADGGLGYDPKQYWWLCNTQVVARFLVVPVVGRAVDLFGPRAMLRVAVIGITLGVMARIFLTDIRYLALNEIMAGCAWCCAETAISVLLFSCNRDPLQRVRLIGFYNVVVNAAVILGTLVGKELLQLDVLPHFSGSIFKTLFLVSILLRLPGLVLAITMLPRLRSLNLHETAGLWRQVRGSGITITIGRGLMGVVFRRPGGG